MEEADERPGPSGVAQRNEEPETSDPPAETDDTSEDTDDDAQEDPNDTSASQRNDAGGRYLLRRLAQVSRSQHFESTSALQSILSMIAGTLGGGRSSRRDQEAESSDSSGASSDLETLLWPCRKKTKREKGNATSDEEQRNTLPDTDFCILTRRALGPSLSGRPLPSLIASREAGCAGSSRNFSSGQQSQILERLFPNKREALVRFKQKVFCGIYSDDGDLFLSACQDQHLRLYDTSHGRFREIKKIRARNIGWSILDTVLSPDKRHLIYSSWCESIHQVDLTGENDNHVALAMASPDDSRSTCVFSLKFSQDGDEILGGGNDRCLYLYDRHLNRQTMRIDGHEDDVNSVAFVDARTHVVASGGDDGLCKIWDRRALRETNPVPVGILAGHCDGLTYIDPRGDGRYLITNSKDQSIKLWDLRKFSSSRAVEETRKAVSNQNWDYRWQNVPRHPQRSGREISEDTSVMTYRGHSILQTLIRCHFSPAHTTSQKYIYTGCASGSVVVYDALTGDVVRDLAGHRSCVRDVSWHPYQPEIMSTSWDFTVARWTYSENLDDEVSSSSRSSKSKSPASDDAKRRKFCVRSANRR